MPLGKNKTTPGALGKKKKHVSQIQEDRIAKVLSGKRMPGSGCHPANPDDVVDGTEKFRIECKGTVKTVLTLHRKFFVQICDHARARHQNPAVQFSFHNIAAGTPADWIAIPVDMFNKMLNYCENIGVDL